MAGKSTLMRQTAIAAILCQMGCFVPAASARLPVFDRIFTRVGAADDLSRGQSTFMVEMSEAAAILRQATQRSLVILDEVGRGTSTQDGMALASAILRDLVERVRCFSLFATHYHELVPIAETMAPVRVMQTEVLEQGGRIVFTHCLKPGASGSSYGIEVARLAGLPDSVIAAACTFLEEHAASFKIANVAPSCPPQQAAAVAAASGDGDGARKGARAAGGGEVQGGARRASEAAVPLARYGLEGVELTSVSARAAAQDPILAALSGRLARLDINRMTPIQAFNLLVEIHGIMTGPRQRALFPEDSC